MWFSRTNIPEGCRGLRFRGNRAVAWLEPGVAWTWWPMAGDRVEVIDLSAGFTSRTPELVAVAPSDAYVALDVAFGEVAVVFVDGLPTAGLGPGRYVLWQLRARVTAETWSTTAIFSSVPQALERFVPAGLLTAMVVGPNQRGVVVVDGVALPPLPAGRHAVNLQDRRVELQLVDLREQELTVVGQEVMTADQVTLRVSLLMRYRVVDPMAFVAAAASVRDALYGEAQLAARRWIAGAKLEVLLSQRQAAAQRWTEEVSAVAAPMGVEIRALDLKDVVLPGEMKDILNRVITAEKEAAANVIRRREELAATRSLATTAQLLEQSPTLLRLKELEIMEAVATKVANLTVVTGAEGLQWLRGVGAR
jgi:regulator of protease activity HflC (stomatin/prohibitin superfamily)